MAATRYRRNRTLRMRFATAALLGYLALLLCMPAFVFAAEKLVTSHNVPSTWTISSDDEDSFGAAGYYGPQDDNVDVGWDGEAGISVRVKKADDPSVGTSYDRFFTSFEDFAERSGGTVTLYPGDESTGFVIDYVWTGAKKTTLSGLEAYSNIGVFRRPRNEDAGFYTDWYQAEWQYWIPTAEGGIYVSGSAHGAGELGDAQFDPMMNDVEAAIASLRINAPGASAASGVPEDPDGEGSGWRTVTGGIAAVAAAAIAMAGAAASTRAKNPDAEQPRPDQPIGYILQLSHARLTVSETHSAGFSAQVYRVMADARYEPAPDAAIVLHLPPGLGAQPPTAYGTLSTAVWQTGAVADGSAIKVEATSAAGSTSSSVPIEIAGISRIVARTEPAGVPLRTQGEDALTLIAAVELLGADSAADPLAVRASLEFAEDSEWLEISLPVDYEDGRAVTVMASQPDPTSVVQPPESATVRVSAQIGERVLTELVSIPLARLPEIDARPDSVTLAADSGSSTEISIRVDNAGSTSWSFETEWREGASPLATPDIVATSPTTATLTLTENAGDRLDPARPESSATLVVVASAEGFEPLRREVQVIVTQEGLFVDRTNVDPSTGAFALRADGSGTPVDIDLRVYVRDEATGQIAADIGLAQTAVLEAGGEEGTSGHAGLTAGGLSVSFAGVRPLNVPSATFSALLERELPTGGEPLAATLRASLPGRDPERFSASVPLRLLGTDTDPFSAAWQVELDGCRHVIGTFVPPEHRERLYALVNERSLTMGAEGLYRMRMGLWSFAHDQILIEKHEHLDAAWWYEQVEETLDWISWCGDIALGVASGAFVGVVGSVAIGMLKPLLVSAMETWVRGGSLEDWLASQTGMLSGVLEGALTDPDFLTKLSGEKKAIGWALFIAYYFAKELYNDPQLSVTNAMKRVGAQLRDEGLIMFLRRIAGAKGGAVDDTRSRSADAATPDAPRAKAPATPDAPDAPRTKPPAQPSAPEAPKAKPETPASKAQPDAPGTDSPTTKPDAGAADTPSAETPARKQPTGPEAEPTKNPADDSAPEEKPDRPEQKAEPETPERPEQKPKESKRGGKPRERADGMAEDIATKTRDGAPLDPATVEKIMRDPDAMRELKKNHPEAWKRFHETRSKTYEAHDKQLEAWIEGNVPEAQGKQVVVRSVGTPDGVDRDYRAGYVVEDPATGREYFVELKKEKWAGKSAEIFAKETGGPTDPAGAQKWAKDHQQLATDQYHAEASVDMADQQDTYNKQTGQWEKTQVTPNIDLVKQGKSTLLDPDGYGKTYETKVAEAYSEGNTLDAYKQADKAVHSLEAVRDGYDMQGYDVSDLPPKVSDGMQVIKDVQTGDLDPASADAKLRGLGYSGGLPDFMEKISGQFAGFKWARKA